MKFDKKIVVSIIVMNIIFAVAVLYISYKTSFEPTALVAAWFGWTTVELWECSKIKREKIRSGVKNDGSAND